MDSIKKHNKHSIRDLTINRKSSLKNPAYRRQREDENGSFAPPRAPRKSFALFAANSIYTFLLALFIFVAASSLLYAYLSPPSAILYLKENYRELNLSSDMAHIAYYGESDDSEEGLTYELENLSESASLTLESDGVSKVKEKAKGTLTVYNKFSKSSQRIINNTRFQASDGKIYRVRSSFVIPGMKKEGGKLVPGKVDVVVYADEAGESYNKKGGTHFVLPGLKNDPERYKKIYAIAKGDISGGFIGEKASISERKKEEAVKKLKEEIINKAYLKLSSKIKNSDKVALKKMIFAEYSEPEIESAGKNKVRLTLSAKLKALLFDKYELARSLLEDIDASLDFDNEKIYIENINKLNFEIMNKEDSDPEKDAMIKFTASGNAKVKWYLDKEEFKRDIAGKNKDVIKILQGAYPAINMKESKARIRPFWSNSFPEDVEKIKLNLVEK